MPVNAVVVIALAIFVLLMLAALFGGAFPQTRQTNIATAWSKGCAKLNDYYKCEATDFDTGYDIDGDGATDNFLKVCRKNRRPMRFEFRLRIWIMCTCKSKSKC